MWLTVSSWLTASAALVEEATNSSLKSMVLLGAWPWLGLGFDRIDILDGK